MAGNMSLLYFSALLDDSKYVLSRHLLMEQSTFVPDTVVIQGDEVVDLESDEKR